VPILEDTMAEMLQTQNLRRFFGHKLTQVALTLLLAYLLYQYGIAAVSAPIPRSMLLIYMGITLFAVLLGISSNESWWSEFRAPLRTLLVEDERRGIIWLRRGIAVVLPLLVGWMTFNLLTPTVQPPAELRAIHPAPPSSISFGGETMNIQGLENPFWSNPPAEPDAAVVAEGREIYATHCIFCHGDALTGDGIFAEGLNPPPADFTGSDTIAQLQQSYLFWRISKGGIGLPNESAPWNSAMPAWEDTLSEDEIWKVIVYLYDAAGVTPRTWEE
ncbi:MAG: c-type cytochrome, partial [Ardenticatenaceae bacterium]